MPFVSVVFLRCSLHRCGLEAAARCTSWPWTETASWTGEGTAAPVSVWNPAGFGEGSASEILTNACTQMWTPLYLFSPARSHSRTHAPKTHTLTHTHANSHRQNTHIHKHKRSLNPFQPTLLKIQFLPRPPDNILLGIIMKNHWWASNVNTIY